MKDIFSKRLASVKWDKMSVSLNKPVIYNKAEEACIGYIYNSEAFVTYAPLEQYEVLSDPVSLGKALDIAVCYDARWRQTLEGTFNYFTFGEPWIFTVDMANRLYMQRGVTGAKTLIATGVTRVSACRGWKHIIDYSIDQGLCVYYVKGTTGYVRRYIETSPDKFGLTSEEALLQLGSIKEIVAKRTNDYRIMIVGSSDVKNDVLAVTERTWPGMSVKPEIIKKMNIIGLSAESGKIQTITDKAIKMQEEHISCLQITDVTRVSGLTDAYIGGSVKYAYNISTNILLSFDCPIFINDINDVRKKLVIKSKDGGTIPVSSLSVHGYNLLLEVPLLPYFDENLTINFGGSSILTTGNKHVGLNTLTLVVLDVPKLEKDPPVVSAANNNDAKHSITVTFDKPLVGDVAEAYKAFTIKGDEYLYSGGPLIEKAYTASSIASVSEKSIVVHFTDALNNLVANAQIEYNPAFGALCGEKGPVDAFSAPSTLTGLVATPPPGCSEIIRLGLIRGNGAIKTVVSAKLNGGCEYIDKINITNLSRVSGTIALSGIIKP